MVFVLCSCRDPGDLCPSFRSMWFVAAVRNFWLNKGGDGFQTQRRKSWVPGQIRAEQMPSRLMTGMNGYVSFDPKPMCGPGGVAGEISLTSRWFAGKTQAGYVCEEQRMVFRIIFLELEVEEDTDCKTKLDEQKKSLQKELRDIEKFTDMEPMVRDSQKEKWKCQLQEIERKRTELLPEDQKMQKRSQKLQSLQDKKRKYIKEACAGEEEMRKANEEVQERRVRFEALSEGSRLFGRRNPDPAGRRGEKRQLCVPQANGCCFDPAVVVQVFACGASHAEHLIQALQEEVNRRFKAPAAPEQMAGAGEREDCEGDWDDEKAASGWYEGATVGPAVDPAPCQEGNGGSFGGGNPSTPRNGLRARDSSRSPRGTRDKMECDGHL